MLLMKLQTRFGCFWSVEVVFGVAEEIEESFRKNMFGHCDDLSNIRIVEYLGIFSSIQELIQWKFE